jgi:putative hydrolase of the HAD superfamily
MNIVFDFGGVVFNWRPIALLQSILPLRAHDEVAARELGDAMFQHYAPQGDWAAFDRGDVDVQMLARRIARRTELSEGDVLEFVGAIPGHLEPIPETVVLLQRLKAAGHRLFYLSNMPAPFADHLERSHAFMDWFDDGVFSSRVQLVKPQPAIFQAAGQRFGLAPGELVFIDDLAHNVDVARRLGWQAIHFRNARDCEAALQSLDRGRAVAEADGA